MKWWIAAFFDGVWRQVRFSDWFTHTPGLSLIQVAGLLFIFPWDSRSLSWTPCRSSDHSLGPSGICIIQPKVLCGLAANFSISLTFWALWPWRSGSSSVKLTDMTGVITPRSSDSSVKIAERRPQKLPVYRAKRDRLSPPLVASGSGTSRVRSSVVPVRVGFLYRVWTHSRPLQCWAEEQTAGLEYSHSTTALFFI